MLACCISFYLSVRITRPIRNIANSAERLAGGEYGVVFKGGHYTEIDNLADTLTRASIQLEKSDMLQKRPDSKRLSRPENTSHHDKILC